MKPSQAPSRKDLHPKAFDQKTKPKRDLFPAPAVSKRHPPKHQFHAPYRVAALSFRNELSRSQHLTSLERAICKIFDGFKGTRVALLPGRLGLPKRRASPDPSWDQEVANILLKHDVNALFETRNGLYRGVEMGVGDLGLAISQSIQFSKEATPEIVQALLNRCEQNGERSISLAGLSIGLLICGENNILSNEQANENKVSIRHGLAKQLFGHVQIVFNGAHTVMGNWGKLERRFEFLSGRSRIALYATNNTKSSWGSSVRIYQGGKKIADGNRSDSLRTHLFADERSDHFRALSLDL